jgi:ribonuclease VapC
MKASCVLDTSALLALIGREKGAEVVAARMGGAIMSAVNWAEAVTVLQNIGLTARDADDMLTRLAIQIIPFDKEQAMMVALFQRTTQPHKLSFGERACLALARLQNIPALTARPVWNDLHVGVEVVPIR